MRSGNVVKVYRDRVDVDQIVKDASSDRRVSDRAPRSSRALSGNVLFRTAAPQLPAVRPGTSRRRTRACRGDGVRARGPGEPGRLDAVSSGHAARQERGDGPGPRRVRARARPAAGSGRGQQRSRSAARAGRRSRRGHRPVSCGAGVDAGVSRRAEQSWLCPPADRPRSRKLARSTKRRWRSSRTFPKC